MVQAKSGSASKDNRKTDVATSGKNASASATSKDSNGAKETSKSWTEELADGTITKKFFTRSSNNDSDADSNDSSTLFGDGSAAKSRANSKAKTTGNDAIASAGKGAFAGVINGKAVATTGNSDMQDVAG